MVRMEKGELHPLEFASRMVVTAFVRATCSRGGSVCKDWFDIGLLEELAAWDVRWSVVGRRKAGSSPR